MGVLSAVSMMRKQAFVSPDRGWKGVFQVKRVRGRLAWDSMVKARTGGAGLEKE